MLNKFVETLGSELANRWLDHLFSPAFLFWTGGLGILMWQQGWDAVGETWQGWEMYSQVAIVVVFLLAVFLSSMALQALQVPILRLLEGYWPWPLNVLGSLIVDRIDKDFETKYNRLRLLKSKEMMGDINTKEYDELGRLEAYRRRHPPSKIYLLPTNLGNRIRARELALKNRYGLDTTVCWPRLWFLLPELERNALTFARTALNKQAELFLWGFLFFVWTVLNPLAAAFIGLVLMIAAYRMALVAADTYGNLLETAFDLHRFALYDSMGWNRPKDSIEEKAIGNQLSEFLWRGTTFKRVQYTTKIETHVAK